MIYERPDILVFVGAFPEAGLPVYMPCHHRHVLKMALAPFVANRAVMWMIEHEPLDDAPPEMDHLRIVDGYAHSVLNLCHAGHDDLALCVLIVAELFHRALPARADGPECRMPAEIGYVEAEVETSLKKVLAIFDIVRLIFYVYRCHFLLVSSGMMQAACIIPLLCLFCTNILSSAYVPQNRP